MVRWHDYTLAFLIGIMIGSMSKVWPWKITLESEIIRGKEYILREENIWPAFQIDLLISLFLMFFGFTTVLILDKLSKIDSKKYNNGTRKVKALNGKRLSLVTYLRIE